MSQGWRDFSSGWGVGRNLTGSLAPLSTAQFIHECADGRPHLPQGECLVLPRFERVDGSPRRAGTRHHCPKIPLPRLQAAEAATESRSPKPHGKAWEAGAMERLRAHVHVGLSDHDRMVADVCALRGIADLVAGEACFCRAKDPVNLLMRRRVATAADVAA